MNNANKRIIIAEEHYTESNYPLTNKPNLSTIGSLIETSTQGPIITFVPYDSIRDLLGFLRTTLYEENNLSPNPVDILSFEISFRETDVAQGKIFKGIRSGIIRNFTVDVDPGYEYIEKFQGRVQGYMMESKNIISSFCFKLKNEDNQIVSFIGQSLTFRLSTKEI